MVLIHIVDDDLQIRDSLGDFFRSEGYDVDTFESGEDALPVIYQEHPDLILLDLNLPGMNGLEVLDKVKAKHPDIEVVMITGYAEITSAVQAMKLGAWDYIKKPFDLDEIRVIVQKAVEARSKNEQLAYLQQEKIHAYSDIIGTSECMQAVYAFIQRVTSTPKTTVLILGETGTGKGLVAKAIHYNSPRANKSFIEINCSAFQPSLLESELFGHEAGAFTDAHQKKKGLLEVAHGGCFFLDEIGDMSMELQAKLLKVLEERTFRRVGGTRELHVDTRIISASSRDLIKDVERGQFRRDLFFRLNVAAVTLPPLRDRGDDILILAQHFINKFNVEFKRNIRGIAPEVRPLLLKHPWVGNVRELRNVIERAVLFETGTVITRESLGVLDLSQPEQPVPALSGDGKVQFTIPSEGISLEEVEKSLIQQALEQTGGNQTRAAALLNLSRETFKYRLKKYKLST